MTSVLTAPRIANWSAPEMIAWRPRLGAADERTTTVRSPIAFRLSIVPFRIDGENSRAKVQNVRAQSCVLIPGTSSLPHLRENLSAAGLDLSGDVLGELDELTQRPA